MLSKTIKKQNKGFTILELLVVIAVLGILAATILVVTTKVRIRARDSRRVADLNQITKALELYYNQFNHYPALTTHVDWTGGWCDNTPSCLAQADQNWDGMISALRSAGLVAEVVPPQHWWNKLAVKIVPEVFASNSNLQDIEYPAVRYEYMPSAVPLNQSYRLRVQLEDPNSPSFSGSVLGKFFWSEDYKSTGPDSCDPNYGFYCTGPAGSYEAFDPGKPVVYLYPTKTEQVSVTVHPKSIDESIPDYGDGWNVIAHPNGDVLNLADEQHYPYLYWEGKSNEPVVDRTKGFVTSSANVENFLSEKLAQLGLKSSEAKEFIDYWAPRMKSKDYVYVYFMPQTDYDSLIPMNINPKPDTVIRVYMLFKSLDQPIKVEPEQIVTPKRTGFTVVEWGGNRSQLK